MIFGDCGHPLHRHDLDYAGRRKTSADLDPSVLSCRVCNLVSLTSFDVRANDEERRGYDAEGTALSTIEREDASSCDREWANACPPAPKTRSLSDLDRVGIDRISDDDWEVSVAASMRLGGHLRLCVHRLGSEWVSLPEFAFDTASSDEVEQTIAKICPPHTRLDSRLATIARRYVQVVGISDVTFSDRPEPL